LKRFRSGRIVPPAAAAAALVACGLVFLLYQAGDGGHAPAGGASRNVGAAPAPETSAGEEWTLAPAAARPAAFPPGEAEPARAPALPAAERPSVSPRPPAVERGSGLRPTARGGAARRIWPKDD
jgi:hypothetical protein